MIKFIIGPRVQERPEQPSTWLTKPLRTAKAKLYLLMAAIDVCWISTTRFDT